MEQISARPLKKGKQIRAFFCLKDEIVRLPFFFQYYRQLGVTEFFAVDNDSTDGSQQYLLDQTDTHVFLTKQKYNQSNAGRDWTSELCNRYGTDQWCLTLDVDEFLVYPYSEQIPLDILCNYLDNHGFQGVYCIFLDMYSDKPLSQTYYQSGDNIFETCAYHDHPNSYVAFANKRFPHIQIKGGPRQRHFWSEEDKRSGPAMRKMPLIKWPKGFEYYYSTHSCTPIRLADITAVLAHFKFVADFKGMVAQEVEQNNRMHNSRDYRKYQQKLSAEDPIFFQPELSCHFAHSRDWILSDMMICSQNYFDSVYSQACRRSLDDQINIQRKQERAQLMDHLQSRLSFQKTIQTWGNIDQIRGPALETILQTSIKLTGKKSLWSRLFCR